MDKSVNKKSDSDDEEDDGIPKEENKIVMQRHFPIVQSKLEEALEYLRSSVFLDHLNN